MYVFKGLICSVHKSGYSISFNRVFGDYWCIILTIYL